MRVVGGLKKGFILKAPKGMTTRPTTDRVKESLFNILAEKIIASCFLDLYAGTGSIGIEALSRGARQAVFVEENGQALRSLKDNLCRTGFRHQALIYQDKVLKVLPKLRQAGLRFEFIFLDPPYQKGCEEPVLREIIREGLLTAEGIVIVESSVRDVLPQQVESLKLAQTRKYGDTNLLFYQRNGCH